MNKRPVSYFQTDGRWRNKPYRVEGETSTIGGSGCGPTCAAMLIETLTGKTFTPEQACQWSVEHGYKALNQGTYYSYFEPQFKEFGIHCEMLSWSKSYGNPDHPNHEKAFGLLKQGYYLIACMGKGLWTRSGHFVVVWWQDGKVHINDPASSKTVRTKGDLQTFKSQVKYYWWIDARRYNSEQEDEDMTQDKFNQMAEKWMESKREMEPASWSKEHRKWAEEQGLITGDDKGRKLYKTYLTREEFVVVMHRFFEVMTKFFKRKGD